MIFFKLVFILLVALVSLKFTTFKITLLVLIFLLPMIDANLSQVLIVGIILDYAFGGLIIGAFRAL